MLLTFTYPRNRRLVAAVGVAVAATCALTSCAEPDLVTPAATSGATTTGGTATVTQPVTVTATTLATTNGTGSAAVTTPASGSASTTAVPAIPTTNSAVVTSGVQFTTSDQKINLTGDTAALCLLTKDSLDASFDQAGTTVKVSASAPGSGSVVVTGKKEFLGSVTTLTTNPASGAFTVTGARDDKAVTFTLKGSCPKR